MEALWQELTYNVEDIMLTVWAEYDGYNYDPQGEGIYNATELLAQKTVKEGKCLRLDQIDTFLGKCFTITTVCEVPRDKFLSVVANFERTLSGDNYRYNSLAFTVHHPGALLGLNGNFYPGPVVAKSLQGDSMLIVKLRTKVKRRKESESDRYITEEELYSCLTKAVRDSARRQSTDWPASSRLSGVSLEVSSQRRWLPARTRASSTTQTTC